MTDPKIIEYWRKNLIKVVNYIDQNNVSSAEAKRHYTGLLTAFADVISADKMRGVFMGRTQEDLKAGDYISCDPKTKKFRRSHPNDLPYED